MQIVQNSHAIADFIFEHPEHSRQWKNQSNSIICLSVKTLNDLENLSKKLRSQGFIMSDFNEPDINNELTAFCILGTPEVRKKLSYLPLTLKEKSPSIQKKNNNFDIGIRLNELSKLEANWYNGYGLSLNKHQLLLFEKYFKNFYDNSLEYPTIFPTIEGNLILEWNNDNNEIHLEINLNDLSSVLYYFNMKDDNDTYEICLDLSLNLSWNILNDSIKNKIKK